MLINKNRYPPLPGGKTEEKKYGSHRKKGQAVGVVGILVFLLLNYPLLQIFNRDTLVVGIPVLVLYLHGIWLVAIAGLYAFANRLTSRE